MNEKQFQIRIARFIFFSTIGLFLSLIIFYIIKGLLPTEFGELIKILAPIKAIYLTALIKYVIANKRNIHETEEVELELNPLYKTITSVLIYAHVPLLILLISLYAFQNAFDFDMLKDLIIYIETFFGAYVGLLMSSIFEG